MEEGGLEGGREGLREGRRKWREGWREGRREGKEVGGARARPPRGCRRGGCRDVWCRLLLSRLGGRGWAKEGRSDSREGRGRGGRGGKGRPGGRGRRGGGGRRGGDAWMARGRMVVDAVVVLVVVLVVMEACGCVYVMRRTGGG